MSSDIGELSDNWLEIPCGCCLISNSKFKSVVLGACFLGQRQEESMICRHCPFTFFFCFHFHFVYFIYFSVLLPTKHCSHLTPTHYTPTVANSCHSNEVTYHRMVNCRHKVSGLANHKIPLLIKGKKRLLAD